MEQVIVLLINSLLQAIPQIIKAIEESKNLNETQKKKLLDDLDLSLLEAKAKVAGVRFREVSNQPVVTYPPITPGNLPTTPEDK
jgi:hypothetical protein